ncbi:MAG: sigma-70 family RNA polymerase sigma factor [Pirellulaceae bacterium]
MLAVHEHENQLIQLVREGDLSAWGELIRIHQDRLYNSIVRVVGHPDRARDVVQDTFIQAIENISRFDGKSQFSTWLYRIAFNRAMSIYRKYKSEVSLEVARENAGDETMADSQDQPEDRVLQSELVEEVHQALEQLSAEHRAVIVLREIEGCEYEQIAEILEVSLGTVRSRLHRARSEMRRLLRGYFDQRTQDDQDQLS